MRGCVAIASAGGVLRPLKAAEVVARSIVADIIAQELRPGSPLPAEASMLAHYEVSRESLREGLRLLEVQGLITIKRGPGGGPVVGAVDPADLGRMTTLYFHMAGATYEELFEAWVVGETLLAERAARHPDAEHRAEVMARYLTTPPDLEGEAEVAHFVDEHAGFHAAVASLAANRVLELTLQSFGLVVSHHVATVDDPRELRHLLAEDHQALAQAIVSGHPRRARALMEDHIIGVADFHRSRTGNGMDSYIEWL